MTSNEFNALHARIVILENLVLKLLAAQPNREEIALAFQAFSAQQIAMHASNGTEAEQIAALRIALEDLAVVALAR